MITSFEPNHNAISREPANSDERYKFDTYTKHILKGSQTTKAYEDEAKRPDTVVGVPAVLHGKPEAIMLFNNPPDILAGGTLVVRDESALEREARAGLALRIDQAMREQVPAGWKGDDTREKQVLNALFPIMSPGSDGHTGHLPNY